MQTTPQEIIIVIGVSVFVFIITFFVLAFILLYQKRKKQYEQEKELMQARFQEEILRSQLEIQEQTFKRISEEIHDNIGQSLSLVKLNINTIQSNDESVTQKLHSARDLVTKSIQDLRDLSKSLHTDRLTSIDLASALEFELQKISDTGIYTTRFENNTSQLTLDKDKQLLLFRMCQEVLNNILKHAEADFISISMNSVKSALVLTISDNGKGFNLPDFSDPNAKSGLGLRNLQGRAKLMNGKLNIDSAPGKGTTVEINVAN